MVLTSIVMIFFMNLSILYTVLIVVNCIGGFLYISSSLITVYQQYANYMDIMEIQKSLLTESQNKSTSSNSIIKQKTKKKYNRFNQFLFFIGILFIIVAGLLFISQISDYITTLIPILINKIIYLSGICLIIGLFLVFFVIKKGRDKMKRIALIEKLIKEGKITPKGTGVNRSIQPRTTGIESVLPVVREQDPIHEVQRQTLNNRLKGLVSSIKTAKAKNQSDEERKIQEKLQVTLNEIRRLKISERRTNNSIVNTDINRRY